MQGRTKNRRPNKRMWRNVWGNNCTRGAESEALGPRSLLVQLKVLLTKGQHNSEEDYPPDLLDTPEVHHGQPSSLPITTIYVFQGVADLSVYFQGIESRSAIKLSQSQWCVLHSINRKDCPLSNVEVSKRSFPHHQLGCSRVQHRFLCSTIKNCLLPNVCASRPISLSSLYQDVDTLSWFIMLSFRLMPTKSPVSVAHQRRMFCQCRMEEPIFLPEPRTTWCLPAWTTCKSTGCTGTGCTRVWFRYQLLDNRKDGVEEDEFEAYRVVGADPDVSIYAGTTQRNN